MAAEYLILTHLLLLTLGALIGCLCIYFGYKLFSQIPVNLTNDGHFKMPNLAEAKLKVAPGIFFAVLGAAIVYFSVSRSVNIRTVGAEGVVFSNTTIDSSKTTSRPKPDVVFSNER